MFEGISKNWGYLTTIGAIVAVAFGAGIWMKTSLDTLEALPKEVESIDQRIEVLEGISKEIRLSTEGISKDIEQSTCALEAQMEMSKNEVLIYAVDLKKSEIEEQVRQLENLDQDFTAKQERKHRRLQNRDKELTSERKEYKLSYDHHSKIYDDCK